MNEPNSNGGIGSVPAPNRIVLNVQDRRPIWAMPDWAESEFREALPPHWSIDVIRQPSGGPGDRDGLEVLEAVKGARVYIGFGIPETVMRAGDGTLEWVHSGAAGVGGSLHGSMQTSGVRFTNSAGIHGPPIADTVLGMLLYFARGFDFAVAGQGRSQWDDTRFLESGTPVDELTSMVVGILGYGGIGREIGKRLRALDVRVMGLRRSPPPADADDLGVELLYGDDGFDQLLASSDALVIAAPETDETRGMMSAGRIRSMKEGALLVNIARGRLLDEEALVQALRDGHLRGAALDVFVEEPLPEDHPLWSLPNVLLTPHVSATTRRFWRREMDLILENFRRFREGTPLLNEVERSRGY